MDGDIIYVAGYALVVAIAVFVFAIAAVKRGS